MLWLMYNSEDLVGSCWQFASPSATVTVDMPHLRDADGTRAISINAVEDLSERFTPQFHLESTKKCQD